MTMTLLTVSALVCVMAVLNGAIVESARYQTCGCGQSWTEINNRCYHYYPTPLTWAQAERNCQFLGGHLASVHNVMEAEQIKKLIHSNGPESHYTWIGASDAQEINQWFWIDGSHFSFTDWCPGEPNTSDTPEQCANLCTEGGKRCWDDIRCNNLRPSICVKEMP